MSERDDGLLLRSLAGELGRTEAAELRARLDADPALRGRMQQLRMMAGALRGARHDAFAAGFAGRVARRARAEYERGPLSAALLGRYFARLVPAVVAILVLLAAYTLRDSGPGQGGVDALLGLAPVTAETLLAADGPGM
ncbi:MAG TPA: hypothetical protein VF665_20395 [Longimicrobium sp.]|jgi:anti-sigma factor RsiW|uniref:hypothetical protein n=1 Tax=Longimicrobium sp. TaxID=2029185 RepID=UPI002ED86E69